ncbi:hypothetical protein PBY51_014020 [Eleginops maclovinus]|uniref:Uncharacterized protein n=1 Tax=Eleginops maclovinus TaxID=56733 RepID=A0AAN7WL26_ELEMC|nr:hypothetical protein PBY51_014020 [Eleginops maclovinus]
MPLNQLCIQTPFGKASLQLGAASLEAQQQQQQQQQQHQWLRGLQLGLLLPLPAYQQQDWGGEEVVGGHRIARGHLTYAPVKRTGFPLSLG